jgi:hypothetical protein
MTKSLSSEEADLFATAIEGLLTASMAVGVLNLDAEVFEDIENTLFVVNKEALWRLAWRGGLNGAELCNEVAEVEGAVTKVDTSDTVPMIVCRTPKGSEQTCFVSDLPIGPECFFRQPGSKADREWATVELLRAYAKTAEPIAA